MVGGTDQTMEDPGKFLEPKDRPDAGELACLVPGEFVALPEARAGTRFPGLSRPQRLDLTGGCFVPARLQ